MIIYYTAIEKYTEGSYKFMFLYFLGKEASEVTQVYTYGKEKGKDRGEMWDALCTLIDALRTLPPGKKQFYLESSSAFYYSNMKFQFKAKLYQLNKNFNSTMMMESFN